MTNRIDTDRISARDDATLMHILTYGFSDLHGDRRDDFRAIPGGAVKRLGRIGRTENGYWHKDTGGMSAARERRQAAAKRADDALLADDLRKLCGVTNLKGRKTATIDRQALDAALTCRSDRSHLNLEMRNVEVVHVKTTKSGGRLVVKRENVQVECKRRPQK